MTIELHDEEAPGYEVKRAYLGSSSELVDGKDVVEDWQIGRNVHARNEPQGGNEEAEAQQTLDQWMGLNRDDMLTLDADAHQHALAQIGDRVYELSQILKEHQPQVVGALTELKCLQLLKSSIQSVLRSFREEG